MTFENENTTVRHCGQRPQLNRYSGDSMPHIQDIFENENSQPLSSARPNPRRARGSQSPVAPNHAFTPDTQEPPVPLAPEETINLVDEISGLILLDDASNVSSIADKNSVWEHRHSKNDSEEQGKAELLFIDLESDDEILSVQEANVTIIESEVVGNDVEEIDSSHLAFIETQGVIEEADTSVREISLKALHHRELPLPTQSLIVSSQVLRQRPSTAPVVESLAFPQEITLEVKQIHSSGKFSQQLRRWSWIPLVFIAGLGLGYLFSIWGAETGKTEPTSVAESMAPRTANPIIRQLNIDASGQIENEAALPMVKPLLLATPAEKTPIAEKSLTTLEMSAPQGPGRKTGENHPATINPQNSLQAAPLHLRNKKNIPSNLIGHVQKQVQKNKEPQQIIAKGPKKEPLSNRLAREEQELQALKTWTASDTNAGILMLTSKPPSMIHIDGRNTGMQTPQRKLRLPPGKHQITLVNKVHQIRDRFTVNIVAGKKTKLIRDNTNKI